MKKMRRLFDKIARARRDIFDHALTYISLAAGIYGLIVSLAFHGKKIVTDRPAVILLSVLLITFAARDFLKRKSAPTRGGALARHVFTVKIPTPAELDEAIGIAQEEFAHDCIRPDVVRELYRKSPSSCLVIKEDKGDAVIGYGDFYAIADANRFARFLRGEITERDLVATDFAGFDKIQDGGSIYLAGAVIKLDNPITRGQAAQALLLGMTELAAKRLFNHVKTATVYATPASESGKKLLEHFDFKPIDGQANAFFQKTITGKTLWAIRSKLRGARHYARLESRVP